ncbi:hypothetical protein NK983_32075, partial [Salmonella enterica subsp. enterica serovar Typhimurium]|nr:hypothetical protein [Salmonella enterica subsp. enterica serovar Typhimurium]
VTGAREDGDLVQVDTAAGTFATRVLIWCEGRIADDEALARSRDQFAMLGRLQARFIAGEPADAVFAGMLDILCELSGCDDGFLG